MSARFFQTIMGRQFIEGTLPNMLKEIKKLNDNLQRLNDNLQKLNEANSNTESELSGDTDE